ncbi:RNA-directed DNA polymerase, eukaryota, reverse transcriptase zinc-binding domain protein, partial [Tanacetum coccineum]
VKIPRKYGDTICSLNDKSNDQLTENEKSENDEVKVNNNGIGEKVRVMDDDKVVDSVESEGLRSNTEKANRSKMNEERNEGLNRYVNKLFSSKDNGNNKLCHVPTVINENGQEFVIFDDELVKEGSKKWEMSACGYFIGYRMSIQELSYHLYRMWGKFGLRHILNNGNGIFKWDPSIDLDITEPTTIPVWIKLMNIPLEAWSQKGLSTLASRIGKPLIMDAMTTKMCNEGMRSLRYARILIEANATKGLVDYIEVLYLNKTSGEQHVKKVKVEYDWKPQSCQQCGVFGHSVVNCPKRAMEAKEEMKENEGQDGFVNVKIGRIMIME